MGKFEATFVAKNLTPNERALLEICGWHTKNSAFFIETASADSFTEFMRQVFFKLVDGNELKHKIIIMLQKLDAYILEATKSDARYERDRLIQELLSEAVFIRRLVAMFGQELDDKMQKEK